MIIQLKKLFYCLSEKTNQMINVYIREQHVDLVNLLTLESKTINVFKTFFIALNTKLTLNIVLFVMKIQILSMESVSSKPTVEPYVKLSVFEQKSHNFTKL